MLAGIISENNHKYNERANLFGKIIRLIPDNGYRVGSKGVFVQIDDFAQTFNEADDEILIKLPIESGQQFYSNAEVDAFFSSFQDSILDTDSITSKYNSMIINVLLSDTKMKGFYNNDNFNVYNGNS